MQAVRVALVMSMLATAMGFQSPGSSSLALRASSSASLCKSGTSLRRSRATTTTMMVTPEQEAAFRAREDAEIAAKRAKEDEDERRYIQQSSGINYRKNEQDKFIFAMGGMIILIPLLAVGVAIGTGYVPLDYLR